LAGNLPREQNLGVQARYFAAAKDWDKAAELYRTLFNFFPDNLDYGLRLAEAQVEAGQRSDAAATVAALRKLPSPAGDDPRIDLTELGAAMAASDYKHELAMAEQAERKGKLTENRLLVAEALFEQGHAYRNLNEPNKAKALFAEARRRFAAVGDRYAEGRVSKQLGIMLAEENDLVNAEKAFQETLQIAHRLGNKSGEAAELDNIATVLLLQRNLTGAADTYERSLALAREVGDQAQVASSLHNLGLVEYDEGHLTRAKQHFQEALPLARRYADKDLIAGCLINLAHVHAAQGNLVAALKLADEAVQPFARQALRAGLAR
jgi:tetratricopeptide (TPR) repeat protein